MSARSAHLTAPLRRIALLMGLVAASLAVASGLHLSGLPHGHGDQYNPTAAGVAEAVICAALLWGVAALLRRGAAGRAVALWVTLFAIAGFAYGLSITARGGDLPDIAYHATTLPLLLVTLALLLPRPSPSRDRGDLPVNSPEKSPLTEKSP
jgi:hypothetical protein